MPNYPVYALPTSVDTHEFTPGDRVQFRKGGGMGKFNNWEADAVAQKFEYAHCTVIAVDRDQISIRSDNGKEDTVPRLWLVPASK